jgi:ADP-heptose:LPS heptosyltransferase
VARSQAVSDTIARAGGRFALLNTGAAWPNKRWPATRLGDLARHLRERHGMTSVVLWGPGERELAETVVAQAAGAALLAPQTTIADIAALAAAASVMVSGDTGPTHIASAVGTPLVGIYGPTRPERNGPLGAADETVSRAAVCRCHHLRQCRFERMCLLDIEVGEVLAAVERRLAATEHARG